MPIERLWLITVNGKRQVKHKLMQDAPTYLSYHVMNYHKAKYRRKDQKAQKALIYYQMWGMRSLEKISSQQTSNRTVVIRNSIFSLMA